MYLYRLPHRFHWLPPVRNSPRTTLLFPPNGHVLLSCFGARGPPFFFLSTGSRVVQRKVSRILFQLVVTLFFPSSQSIGNPTESFGRYPALPAGNVFATRIQPVEKFLCRVVFSKRRKPFLFLGKRLLLCLPLAEFPLQFRCCRAGRFCFCNFCVVFVR